MEVRVDVHASSPPVIVLSVNDVELLSLHRTAAGTQLASDFADALNAALRQGDNRAAFTVQQDELVVKLPGGARLAVELRLLAEPSGNREEMATELDSRWRQAMNARQLRVEPSSVAVPVGESRATRLIDAGTGSIRVMNPFPALVDVSLGDGCLKVAGIQEGKGHLWLRMGEQAVRIPFTVLRLAAYLPDRLTLQLSGSGYEPSEIERLSRVQLMALSSVAPEASLAMNLRLGGGSPNEEMALDVSATAPARIKVTKHIPVEILGTGFPPPEPESVLFSNEPEQITEPGRLFCATLMGQDRVRLVYHHQNRSGQPLRLRVQLRDLSDAGQRVFFRGGASGPALSTITVGFASVRSYLAQLASGQGCVLALGRSARASLWEGELANLDSASGNLDLAVLTEGPVAVLIDALPSRGGLPSPPPVAALPEEPQRYSPAAITRRFSYDLDGHWLFIRLGRGEMRRMDSGIPLMGDYGLLAEFEVDLMNAQPRSRTVEFAFDATGGEARGVFIIDGSRVETPSVHPGAPRFLTRFTVQPYETRRVHILTMPLNGSHYPASLVFSCLD